MIARSHRKSIIFILLTSILLVNSGLRVVNARDSEKELFLIAQKAFEDGFYDVAMKYIDQLLTAYPQTDKRIPANLLLGQCYFFKNQYLQAYEIFQSLVQYPEYKDVTLYWLGETYLKGTDYVRAEEQYRQLIEVYPDSPYAPQTYYSLGWLFFEQRKFKESKKIFQKLAALYPDHQLREDAAFKIGETSYQMQNFETAIEEFQNFAKRFPKSSQQPEAFFYIAESYYYLGNPLSAVSFYAKTADLSFSNQLILMAKVSLGWSYLRLEKWDLSLQYFEDALSFSKKKGIPSDDIHLGLANLYSEREDFPNAAKSYNILIKDFPESPRLAEAMLGKANVHYQMKEFADAVKTYQATIKKFSEDSEQTEIVEKAYFGLAWSFLKSGNIDLSIRSFQSIRNQAKNKIVKISALTQIGDAYQDVGQLEKAIDVYDQLLKNFPESMYADYVQYRQGIALLKLDKIEAATLSFQGLQANFPNSNYLNDVEYYLAVAYFKKEDWNSSLESIQNFIAHLSDDSDFWVEAHHILALSNFNLKRYKESLKVFKKIIENAPEQSELIRDSEFNIAKCYYELKEIPVALKKLNILINKYPQTHTAEQALKMLGDHYLENSDLENAIEYYTQMISFFPGSNSLAMVQFNLSQAYEGKGEIDKAVNILKQINQSSGREIYAKAQLAIADLFSQDIDSVTAIATYQKIIASSPEYQKDAYKKLAEYYRGIKNYEKSLEAYRSALNADAQLSQLNDAELQFYIADTYELLHKTEETVENYLKISYLYPNESPWVIKSYLRIARIFEDQENWKDAIKIYNKIIELNTDELKFAQERLEWINENTVELNL